MSVKVVPSQRHRGPCQHIGPLSSPTALLSALGTSQHHGLWPEMSPAVPFAARRAAHASVPRTPCLFGSISRVAHSQRGEGR